MKIRPNAYFCGMTCHTIRFILLFFAVFTSTIGHAQDGVMDITWERLSQLELKEAYDENSGTFYDKPIFGPGLKGLEGKEVSITGYVIPMDVELNYYVVSAFPFSSCFFCGGAGPETVIDLQLSDKELSFKNDERATFCGELRLNTGTFFELPYILKNARVCEKED